MSDHPCAMLANLMNWGRVIGLNGAYALPAPQNFCATSVNATILAAILAVLMVLPSARLHLCRQPSSQRARRLLSVLYGGPFHMCQYLLPKIYFCEQIGLKLHSHKLTCGLRQMKSRNFCMAVGKASPQTPRPTLYLPPKGRYCRDPLFSR